MIRKVPHLLLALMLLPAGAAAAPILQIDAPLVYTPGTPFDLTVTLIGAESLALYNVELLLSAPEGSAGDDFLFAAAAEPVDRYVFIGQANDGFAYSILADSRERITLSDLLIAGGVTTVEGANDLVGHVTVLTTASASADLTVSVVAASLELDAAGAAGVIGGFDYVQANLPVRTIPIPEPTAMALMASALAWGACHRRRLS